MYKIMNNDLTILELAESNSSLKTSLQMMHINIHLLVQKHISLENKVDELIKRMIEMYNVLNELK